MVLGELSLVRDCTERAGLSPMTNKSPSPILLRLLKLILLRTSQRQDSINLDEQLNSTLPGPFEVRDQQDVPEDIKDVEAIQFHTLSAIILISYESIMVVKVRSRLPPDLSNAVCYQTLNLFGVEHCGKDGVEKLIRRQSKCAANKNHQIILIVLPHPTIRDGQFPKSSTIEYELLRKCSAYVLTGNLC